MTPADLRSLAADHAHIRHHPHEVAAALLAAADWIEHYEKRVADLVNVANAFAAETAEAAAGERRMRAAITSMIDGIERWLDTGTPAGPEESKAIYEQLCQAVGREPQP